jgi:hypothetical protein
MKQVTTLRAWLSQVPPCKIVAALGRDANNATRDKKRILNKVDDLEKVAKAQGVEIEVRFSLESSLLQQTPPTPPAPAEFHTLDIGRLLDENALVKGLIELFEASKTFHIMPNDNSAEYNRGYVKGMCNSIYKLKEIF